MRTAPLAPCTVRPAQDADLPQIARMVSEGARFHADLDATRYRAGEPEALSRMLMGLLAERSLDRGLVLVAEYASHLVATAQISRRVHPRKALRHAEEVLHIGWLWVDKAYRGRGVAQALVTEAEARARAAGITRVQCEIHTKNTVSKFFFQRSGYKQNTVLFARAVS